MPTKIISKRSYGVLSLSARRRILLALIPLVVAISTVGILVAIGGLPFLGSAPRPDDCPLQRPLAGITAEQAVEIVKSSYSDSESWFFSASRLVRFCEKTGSWWSSPDGEEWDRVANDDIPGVLKTYATHSRIDLVFHVVSANRCCILTVDEGWVDGVSAELVAKIRIAS